MAEKQNDKKSTLKKTITSTRRKKVDRLEQIASNYAGYDLYKVEKEITKEQCAFLAVYSTNYSNLSHAGRAIGKSRSTIYKWQKENAVFKEEMEICKEDQLDSLESELHKMCSKDELDNVKFNAVKFALSTIGRDRGYGDKTEVKASIEVTDFDFEEVTEEDFIKAKGGM